MRPLSATYAKDLIFNMIVYDCASISTKNLILSSQEMTHTFGIFMEGIFLSYGDVYVCLMIKKGEEISMHYTSSQSTWMIPFVRRLLIECDPDAAAISFFEKVYHANKLVTLDLFFLKEKYNSLEVIKNLMSITRRLAVNASSLYQIKAVLPRFETIFFGGKDYHHFEFEPFAHIWNADSSTALEFYCKDPSSANPFINALVAYRNELRQVRRVYFVWKHRNASYNDQRNFERLLSCLTTCYPTVEDVYIGVEASAAGPIRYSAENDWYSQKSDFDSMAETLGTLPPQIKAKAFFVVKSKCHADPVTSLERRFPPENFAITTGDQLWTVVNRQKKLTENVEYFYQHDVKRLDVDIGDYDYPNFSLSTDDSSDDDEDMEDDDEDSDMQIGYFENDDDDDSDMEMDDFENDDDDSDIADE